MNAHERSVVTEENKTAVRGARREIMSATFSSAALPWPFSPGSSSSISSGRDQQGPTRRFTSRSRMLPAPTRYGNMRPRLYSEKGCPTPRSCSSASSLEIERTAKAVRSSGQRDSYWTERWRKRASSAGAFT